MGIYHGFEKNETATMFFLKKLFLGPGWSGWRAAQGLCNIIHYSELIYSLYI